MVALRSRRTCRDLPDFRRGLRAPPTSRPRPRGWRARQVTARELYGRMMRTLAQTGNGWMTFKDKSNRGLQPDRRCPGNVVHLSNLCTEILEVTSGGETAVCNLGSINLARHHAERRHFDFEKLGAHRPQSRCASWTGSSTSTTTRSPQPATSNTRGARSASA